MTRRTANQNAGRDGLRRAPKFVGNNSKLLKEWGSAAKRISDYGIVHGSRARIPRENGRVSKCSAEDVSAVIRAADARIEFGREF